MIWLALLSLACADTAESEAVDPAERADIPPDFVIDATVEALQAKQSEQDRRLEVLTETVKEIHGEEAARRIEEKSRPAEEAAEAAQEAAGPRLRPVDGVAGENLMNAPAIATELADKLASYQPGAQAHVVNLSLLPLTEEDLAYLDRRLGQGTVTILSRGYGNCRISSTAVKNAWRVRYFNSREVVILDTVEVVDVPAVACAAKEDLEDSAQRLGEILGVYR